MESLWDRLKTENGTLISEAETLPELAELIAERGSSQTL
jgi:hypothetical protein